MEIRRSRQSVICSKNWNLVAQAPRGRNTLNIYKAHISEVKDIFGHLLVFNHFFCMDGLRWIIFLSIIARVFLSFVTAYGFESVLPSRDAKSQPLDPWITISIHSTKSTLQIMTEFISRVLRGWCRLNMI